MTRKCCTIVSIFDRFRSTGIIFNFGHVDLFHVVSSVEKVSISENTNLNANSKPFGIAYYVVEYHKVAPI